MTAGLAALLCGPRLRAALNTGNTALVQTGGGRLSGVSPMLAERLAWALGVPLAPVMYPSAGRVWADAGAGRWDVAFLAAEPARAAQMSFTAPYHRIAAAVAVRASSTLTDVHDLDRPGVTILTATGAAYELHLTAKLRHAQRIAAPTPGDSFAWFRAGAGDAVAGVRAALARHFGADPAYRLLPSPLAWVHQAMALPGPAHPALPALDAFLAAAIAEGAVAAALDR